MKSGKKKKKKREKKEKKKKKSGWLVDYTWNKMVQVPDKLLG